jgi:gas vesicle protein
MKSQIKQILRQICLLNNRLSLAEKIIFCFLSLVLANAAFEVIYNSLKVAANYVLQNYKNIFLYFLGVLLFGVGCYLLISRVRRTKNNLDSSFTDKNTTSEPRTIYTEGNYNEFIQGDYIEIQGDYTIQITEDFSNVATQIRELITQLKNQGYSEENAETIIASELAEQARKNSKIRKKLFNWRKSFRGATAKANNGNDETEAAREVVKRATTYSYTSSNNFTEVVGGNFQKLEELLRARKWKEADKETEKIIHQLSREEVPEGSLYRHTLFVNNLSDEHIRVLPEKDLNIINNLWLKHSNGRFGFSVQKRIWKSLGGRPYPNYNTEIGQNFGDIVGWRKEGDWVYYSDINYSLTAPPGHLPIIVMLKSDTSQRCSIHQSIFGVFVGRQYNATG